MGSNNTEYYKARTKTKRRLLQKQHQQDDRPQLLFMLTLMMIPSLHFLVQLDNFYVSAFGIMPHRHAAATRMRTTTRSANIIEQQQQQLPFVWSQSRNMQQPLLILSAGSETGGEGSGNDEYKSNNTTINNSNNKKDRIRARAGGRIQKKAKKIEQSPSMNELLIQLQQTFRRLGPPSLPPFLPWIAGAVAMLWLISSLFFSTPPNQSPNYVFYESTVYESRTVNPTTGKMETSRKESVRSNLPSLVEEQQRQSEKRNKQQNQQQPPPLSPFQSDVGDDLFSFFDDDSLEKEDALMQETMKSLMTPFRQQGQFLDAF